MNTIARGRIIPCTLLATVAFTGCSGKDQSSALTDPKHLEFITLAVLSYADDHKRGPASVEDLKPYLKPEPGFDPEPLFKKMQSGEIVVPWAASSTDLYMKSPDQSPLYVIVYEKDAPVKGGYVVMNAGKPKQVTAEEFKTLKVVPTPSRKQ